jgi:23S rRNA (adenine2503-C2)-methyltransferase
MKILGETGDSSIATVYMAEQKQGKIIEFVEALQTPYARSERWVLMVSTLYGCPVRCMICDAGGQYQGKPTAEQIFEQIDYMVDRWFPERIIPCQKFKIQFARMGEPALNPAVLEVLEKLPSRYDAPGLIPSISTIAPHGCDKFLEAMLEIKNGIYFNGRFQFQYSLHSTNEKQRDQLIPVRKWGFKQLSAFGDRYFQPGDRKITLNFALAKGMELDPIVLLSYFDPAKYMIKITPVNPTCQAVKNGLISYVDLTNPGQQLEITEQLNCSGYDVIVSIGEIEENRIGSNCGQYVLKYMQTRNEMQDGYTYPIKLAVG